MEHTLDGERTEAEVEAIKRPHFWKVFRWTDLSRKSLEVKRFIKIRLKELSTVFFKI